MRWVLAIWFVAVSAQAAPDSITPQATSQATSPTPEAQVVSYQFDIDELVVNYTGTPRKALAVAGQIPAPTVRATVGDTLKVTFRNNLAKETSIHWHGVLLPPAQDGVPYLNTAPIAAGGSHTFEYKVVHSGTFWYHAHTGLDEQRGIYGSVVFSDPAKPIPQDRDYVVVLSDWIDANPIDAFGNLKRDADYYANKKGSRQSWAGRIAAAFEVGSTAPITSHLMRAWMRMGDLDLADIGYDAFLANGSPQTTLLAKAGERVRLRLINGSASSYFVVEMAVEFTVVAADGNDVVPFATNRLKIATAETYDIEFTPPDPKGSEPKSYEIRANAIDGTGYASVVVGDSGSQLVKAPAYSKPNYYLMEMAHHSSHNSEMPHPPPHTMPHSEHNSGMPHPMPNSEHNSEMAHPMPHPMPHFALEYARLRSPTPTLITAATTRTINLSLTGDMERYIWSFNDKTLGEESKILIKKGERVRFVLHNSTMMEHPIHLHGHFFRVLNGQGDYSPLKHTVNVPPAQQVTIEFDANMEQDWFFHCHNLYHMVGGMARAVSYEATTKATDQTFASMDKDIGWFAVNQWSATTNAVFGSSSIEKQRHMWLVDGEYGLAERGYEVDLLFQHNRNRFYSVYVGGNLTRDGGDESPKERAVAGATYLLPLLIEADGRINSDGNWEGEFGSEHQLTDTLSLEWYWRYELAEKQDRYMATLEHQLANNASLVFTYSSHYKSGVGMQFSW